MQVPIMENDLEEMERVLRNHKPKQILFEYSHYARMMGRTRQLYPEIGIAVRAHNIEPLQHLDNHGWMPKRGPFWVLYGISRLLMSDIRTKQLADVILSINEWEKRAYWDWLPGRAKVEWLPYISPDHLLPVKPEPFENRKIIACLPTSQENRKSLDLVFRFQQFAREMKRQGSRNEFVVTGNLKEWKLPAYPEVNYAGFIDDLPRFMGRCRAVCMLSPLGYGFKTTIADALAAGAHVIAHPDLIRRTPRHVQRFLISADQKMGMLLSSLQVAPQAGSVRVDSIRRAGEIMNRFFRENS